MRFKFKGCEYEILFNRKHDKVEVIDRKKNEKKEELSQFPFTTVTILVVDDQKKSEFWEVVASATVGCIPSDKFTLEHGRIAALKKLTGRRSQGRQLTPSRVPVGMETVIWEAYTGRQKGPSLRQQNQELRELNKKLKDLADTAMSQSQEWHGRYSELLTEHTQMLNEENERP